MGSSPPCSHPSLYLDKVFYVWHTTTTKKTIAPMRTAWFSEYSVDSFWRWPPQKAPKLPARPCAPPDYWSNGEGLQADDGVLENTQGASSYTSYEFQAWGWKYWKTHKVVIMVMLKPSWSSCRDENYSDWVCWVPHHEWGWMWHNHDVEYGQVEAWQLILLGSSWSGARYVHRKLAHGPVAGFQDGQRPLQQVLRGSHRDLNWFYI